MVNEWGSHCKSNIIEGVDERQQSKHLEEKSCEEGKRIVSENEKEDSN